MRTFKPTEPTVGEFPTITYIWDPDTERHEVLCSCGKACSTTEEITARNFASQHIGLHARNRIVTPQKAEAV